MKNKILILPLLLLALVGMVYADSFIVPASDGTLSGTTAYINISLTTQPNLTANCTITGNSVIADNNTIQIVARNTTLSQGQFANVTFSTIPYRDAGDWILTATCYNNTMQQVSTFTQTSVNFNNTIPVIDTCLIGGTTASTRTVSASTQTFACTIYNATSANIYWRNSAGLSADGSSNSNTQCTNVAFSDSYGATGLQLSCNIYSIDTTSRTLYFDILDGADTVTGTSYSLTIEGRSTPGDGQQGQIVTQITTLLENKKIVSIVVISVLVLLFLGIGYMMSKK